MRIDGALFRHEDSNLLTMKLSFEPQFLLFGLSYMWLIIQISSPYLIWPNFAKTRGDHVLRARPRLLNFLESFATRTKVTSWASHLIMANMVSLNVAILLCCSVLQPIFLASIGIKDTTKLSYKVLIYIMIGVVSNSNRSSKSISVGQDSNIPSISEDNGDIISIIRI